MAGAVARNTQAARATVFRRTLVVVISRESWLEVGAKRLANYGPQSGTPIGRNLDDAARRATGLRPRGRERSGALAKQSPTADAIYLQPAALRGPWWAQIVRRQMADI